MCSKKVFLREYDGMLATATIFFYTKSTKSFYHKLISDVITIIAVMLHAFCRSEGVRLQVIAPDIQLIHTGCHAFNDNTIVITNDILLL